MKKSVIGLNISIGLFLAYSANADIGFTKEDVNLVRYACLAGTEYDFSTNVDGSLSVKNLQGKGSFKIDKRKVTTVDLPDEHKREEFTEIRNCIKGYLIKVPQKNPNPKPTVKQRIKKTFKLFRTDVDRHHPGWIYIGCGDPLHWAHNVCDSKPIIETLENISGGACGNMKFRVTCYIK